MGSDETERLAQGFFLGISAIGILLWNEFAGSVLSAICLAGWAIWASRYILDDVEHRCPRDTYVKNLQVRGNDSKVVYKQAMKGDVVEKLIVGGF